MTAARLACLAAVLASGCFELTLRADDYDRACTAASDCAVVFEGDACAVCACPNAAVAVSAHERYEADAVRLRGWCGPQPAIACGPCPESAPACLAGRCDVASEP